MQNNKEENVRILFIGDISGGPGRKVLNDNFGLIKERYSPDLIIANGENASGGFGITPKNADELFNLGIDVITMGNHTWSKKSVKKALLDYEFLIRPLNYSPYNEGKGSVILKKNDKEIGVINLCGRVFLDPIDCPFRVGLKEIERIREITKLIIVDFHAEATAEKLAFSYYVDGKVSAVIGTHTHIQTADSRILPKGTAYITDVGMTGAEDSILGLDINVVIERFLRMTNSIDLKIAEGKLKIDFVLIDVDSRTGKALNITNFSENFN